MVLELWLKSIASQGFYSLEKKGKGSPNSIKFSTSVEKKGGKTRILSNGSKKGVLDKVERSPWCQMVFLTGFQHGVLAVVESRCVIKNLIWIFVVGLLRPT